MSVSVLAVARGAARCARGGTGFHSAGMRLLSRCRGGWCWSAGRGQGAEPVPAGEEGVVPGPVRADLEDLLAGVADEPGGQVPDPVAERVRLGVPQVRLVVQAEEPGPGGEVGGDVRREDPSFVDLPGLR